MRSLIFMLILVLPLSSFASSENRSFKCESPIENVINGTASRFDFRLLLNTNSANKIATLKGDLYFRLDSSLQAIHFATPHNKHTTTIQNAAGDFIFPNILNFYDQSKSATIKLTASQDLYLFGKIQLPFDMLDGGKITVTYDGQTISRNILCASGDYATPHVVRVAGNNSKKIIDLFGTHEIIDGKIDWKVESRYQYFGAHRHIYGGSEHGPGGVKYHVYFSAPHYYQGGKIIFLFSDQMSTKLKQIFGTKNKIQLDDVYDPVLSLFGPNSTFGHITNLSLTCASISACNIVGKFY